MREAGIPGVAIAVVVGDRVAYAKGFGEASAETHAAVTPETLFQIGSTTKTFTAAALALLELDGQLRLDEPIGRRVPGLAPALAEVTTAQLLAHVSGLRDQPAEYGEHHETALAEYARSLRDADRLFPPGMVFSYSNPGYALAGLVLQQAAGKPYADVMRERLFAPLGMARTTFRPTEAMTHGLAVGHGSERGGAPRVIASLADDTRFWPAGYMYSSASEVARFAAALLNRGQLDGKTVVPETLASVLSAPRAAMPNVFAEGRYGYGLMMYDWRGARVWEHGGSMPGFSALLRLVPERRLALVVLGNAERPLRKTVQKAMELLLPDAPPASEPATVEQPLPVDRARYVGRYENRMTMEVLEQNGTLSLKTDDGGAPVPIRSLGGNRFRTAAPEGQRPLEFVMEPAAPGRPGYLHFVFWALKKT
jgi:CubicO group peptidase (beta-lactamase class C family)